MKITFKIHLFYYLVAFICFINGYFRDFILISMIIIIHELGHIAAAIHYNWKIEKVVILPFGGITIFNEILNKPILEEFIIAIMGPLFQIILFVIINLFVHDVKFNFYCLVLLIFNLVPIYPLDGAKIINLLSSKFLPYQISHSISIYLSYILLFVWTLFLILNPNLIFFITLLFLFLKVLDEHKNHKYMYNKFLFERYIYNIKFSKIKRIDNIKNFYRECKHIIKSNNKYISENNILKKLFDN